MRRHHVKKARSSRKFRASLFLPLSSFVSRRALYLSRSIEIVLRKARNCLTMADEASTPHKRGSIKSSGKQLALLSLSLYAYVGKCLLCVCSVCVCDGKITLFCSLFGRRKVISGLILLYVFYFFHRRAILIKHARMGIHFFGVWALGWGGLGRSLSTYVSLGGYFSFFYFLPAPPLCVCVGGGGCHHCVCVLPLVLLFLME